MHTDSTPKYEVAVELLDWAIRAYVSGEGYYAALHLAGAAEEVLAVYLRAPENDLQPAADSFHELVSHLACPADKREAEDLKKYCLDRMNGPRNSVKHKRGHGDNVVTFDAEEEASESIERAYSNYTQLLRKIPLRDLPSIGTFELARRAKRAHHTG
ncbi:hypothetical protein [Delftia sp. JD2]|uniref:hypothetical protein n=1 Tax=Delftia sp. JD2 TaxID=469553 RepID=UPI0008069EF4|nr:hypothetical protein [Delftia sp. JD2]OBY81762.1 hypothetical protein ACM14_29880 [Delftia sp. JD2]